MYYRQPEYFGKFRCIGGDCPDNCCYGWQIMWQEDEVEKLRNAPGCSAELTELVDRSFVKDENHSGIYRVKFDERGKCPFVTDEGLCRIQKDIGVECMSYTCMVYPRNYIVDTPIIYRFCNMSCREVMNMLLNDEKSMNLINAPAKEGQEIKNMVISSPELISERPEYKYRGELLEFFYEIIADKKHDVETNLVIGALAAQSLTKFVQGGEAERIPEALKAIKAQLHNGAQLKQIDNIKPNYNVKLGVLSEAFKLVSIYNVMAALIDNTKTLNVDLYLQGEQQLAENFKNRPYYFRNIALNLMFELALPLKFKEMSIFENYSIYVTALAMFKLNAVATSELILRYENQNASANHDMDWYLTKSGAQIGRFIGHNEQIANLILEYLIKYKMTTPAYLALLVK